MKLDAVLKGASIPAVLVGIGLAAATPILLRGVNTGSRSLAKSLLHKYFDLADKFQELTAEKQEQWRDLLAEVQAERQAHEVAEMTGTANATMNS